MKGELPDKQNYSIKEVADHLGFSPEVVRLWCRKGDIGAQKIGNGRTAQWRISRESLDEFLKIRR